MRIAYARRRDAELVIRVEVAPDELREFRYAAEVPSGMTQAAYLAMIRREVKLLCGATTPTAPEVVSALEGATL